ncbi:MAG: UDP-N-acetylmuramoyl-L-alanine--D-glutamate ligase [Zetaproteobacteria bacterium CG12_big_fil_rev_8_21_14_0_65_55_1124]|nr:MAG: UDP-N-acetylmuramoylalanine--D-glutamate ligase [Zetaproteobacteria bacterium CG1_02_55_237]PIS19908.1 MAG: UDP-N-acetylmuramoyl-L-alanine--D-glutamate ligase [Zetaproteobacteria bacterium CG08_land_8_20_14_0_20_55_17]PIW43669.1 MAG: UDP-N-acetylmuramoyl-L-alanine--D-glutamate ligase [Zetaproteobacteria bacterium CG12_big_fil_rev_8_21_14_0_65_55_1124]PIY52662.1 MAG: UDP-N-acetylmuramoyl-L-alanine--D-glutamate ligase [Zetaproteobacteria bacterium CG_4_10_14_0_8_um_filter_55_43]PIZ37846.1
MIATRSSSPDVAVIGMGRTGCSVARFLTARGIEFVAFDEKLKALPEDIHAQLHSGKLSGRVLKKFSRLIVSPGIPWHHPALEEAHASGVELIGDLDLFRENFAGDLLGVTGTNGKSTVVHLMGQILEVLPGGVEVGGNIGVPMLEMLDKEKPSPRAVLELSSFQLERCRGIHPHWAVLLNIQPDHADMHADMAEYEAAKVRLFEQQGQGDIAMLPLDEHWNDLAWRLGERGVYVRRFGPVSDFGQADAGLFGEPGARHIFWTSDGGKNQVAIDQVRVRGEHQHINLAVAAQAASDSDVSQSVIAEALTAFRGLDHRLRYVGKVAGKAWYDDSKATNPDAAVAALNSFDKVIWICGGLTKGLDLMPMLPDVQKHVGLALVIGVDTRPFAALLEESGVPYLVVTNIDEAVAQAGRSSLALPVLLSPAAASMDQFRDYADRGRCFCDAVVALETTS